MVSYVADAVKIGNVSAIALGGISEKTWGAGEFS
ncbi:hypothetical protein MNBD_GAMMA18-1518 [hydrothermal vent metagenome]|uniref:Uncharacterized protein n=1 Tax=hydrothermal vent metagenome TaxID=652676 RepID=A0A3B0Z8Y3_9ZZZZ